MMWPPCEDLFLTQECPHDFITRGVQEIKKNLPSYQQCTGARCANRWVKSNELSASIQPLSFTSGPQSQFVREFHTKNGDTCALFEGTIIALPVLRPFIYGQEHWDRQVSFGLLLVFLARPSTAPVIRFILSAKRRCPEELSPKNIAHLMTFRHPSSHKVLLNRPLPELLFIPAAHQVTLEHKPKAAFGPGKSLLTRRFWLAGMNTEIERQPLRTVQGICHLNHRLDGRQICFGLQPRLIILDGIPM